MAALLSRLCALVLEMCHTLQGVPVLDRYSDFARSLLKACFVGPEDDYISFHIQGVGGWTKRLYSLCEEKLAATAAKDLDTHPKKVDLELGLDDESGGLIRELEVNVDGPFGAPAQDHSSYSSLLLVVSNRLVHCRLTGPYLTPKICIHRCSRLCTCRWTACMQWHAVLLLLNRAFSPSSEVCTGCWHGRDTIPGSPEAADERVQQLLVRLLQDGERGMQQ